MQKGAVRVQHGTHARGRPEHSEVQGTEVQRDQRRHLDHGRPLQAQRYRHRRRCRCPTRLCLNFSNFFWPSVPNAFSAGLDSRVHGLAQISKPGSVKLQSAGRSGCPPVLVTPRIRLAKPVLSNFNSLVGRSGFPTVSVHASTSSPLLVLSSQPLSYFNSLWLFRMSNSSNDSTNSSCRTSFCLIIRITSTLRLFRMSNYRSCPASRVEVRQRLAGQD